MTLNWTAVDRQRRRSSATTSSAPPDQRQHLRAGRHDDDDIVHQHGLTAGTAYRYQVRARDAAGNTSPSPRRIAGPTATCDAAATDPPGHAHGTNVSSSSITMTWTASTDNVGVTGYDI